MTQKEVLEAIIEVVKTERQTTVTNTRSVPPRSTNKQTNKQTSPVLGRSSKSEGRRFESKCRQ